MNKTIKDYTGYCLHHLAHVAVQGILSQKGNVIELGAGWISLLMGSLLKTHGLRKKVFACDCFGGMPYTDSESSSESFHSTLSRGMCFQGDAENFKTEIKNMGLEDYVTLVPGLIEETLESVLGAERFCFAWCDVDLYKSTLVGYKFLEDRILKGGILGFHDYGFSEFFGVTKVVKEILDRDKYKEIYRQAISIFFQRRA